MTHEMEKDVQQRARDLAARITVAHDLDPEIQEELYGHIEDKMLAYINGEEAVSPEDAFILVREHFGDASVVGAMFANVHERAATLTLGRRIGAAMIVTLAVAWLCKVFAIPLQGLAFRLIPENHVVNPEFVLGWCLFHADAVLYPLGVILAFRYWRGRLDQGARPWFYRWTAWDFFRVGILLLAVLPFTPSLDVATYYPVSSGLAPFGSSLATTAFGSWAIACAISVAWLWWCGAELRRPKGIALCLGSWLSLQAVQFLAPVQMILLTVENASNGELLSSVFAGTELFGEGYAWVLHRNSISASIATFPAQLSPLLIAAFCGLAIHFVRTTTWGESRSREREFTDSGGRVRVLGVCLLSVANSHLLVEGRGWEAEVWTVLLVVAATTALYGYVSLVQIPRAIAGRRLYRLRALRHASNVLFLTSLLVPLYVQQTRSFLESPAKATYGIMLAGALGWMAALAWRNWRRDRSGSESRIVA